VSKWQPIETAPKDGTPILACCGGYDEEHSRGSWPMTVYYGTYHPNSPGKKEWRDHSGHKRPYLEYWMPLPPTPEDQ